MALFISAHSESLLTAGFDSAAPPGSTQPTVPQCPAQRRNCRSHWPGQAFARPRLLEGRATGPSKSPPLQGLELPAASCPSHPLPHPHPAGLVEQIGPKIHTWFQREGCLGHGPKLHPQPSPAERPACSWQRGVPLFIAIPAEVFPVDGDWILTPSSYHTHLTADFLKVFF